MESAKKILIVDDSKISRTILSGLFKDEYIVDEASNGKEGFELILQNPTSYCVVLLDLNMPVMNGYEFIEKMQAFNLINSIPIIVVTAENSETVETKVLEMGVSDIVNSPIVPKTVFCRVQNVISANNYRKNLESTTKELTKKLRKSNEIMIDTLSSIIEHRSLESGQHIKRIKSFTEILLNEIVKHFPELGLDSKTIQCIASASTLHDIGKIIIPDSILNKPGRLTKEEFEVMKTHSVQGGEIIKKLRIIDRKEYLEYAWQIAMYHHERYDGKGYPFGLAGEEIPLAAQVAAIADVYDALTTPRVYKPAFSHDVAVRMIICGECGSFSEKIRQCFRLCAYKFEEKARQYRDGEIILEEFGSDLQSALENNQATEFFDIYRYQPLLEQVGDIVLELDYTTKEYSVLRQNIPNFSSFPLFGNISSDIQMLLDKLVHPEDCSRLSEEILKAKKLIEANNFVKSSIFVRLRFNEESEYQLFEIQQVKINIPDKKSIKTIVTFRNIEKYTSEKLEETKTITILENTEKENKIIQTLSDIGITTKMIYEMSRSACDILYILNLDSGEAFFECENEDYFTKQVPRTINDFVTDSCITIHKDDLENVLEKTSKSIRSFEESTIDFRMMNKAGEYKLYNQKIIPIKGNSGIVSHIIGFVNCKRA